LFGNAILTDPGETTAAELYFSALSKRTLGDFAEAERLCRKSIELSPKKLSSRVVLGEILLARGNYIEGFDYFENWPELQAALGLSEIPQMPFPRWRGENLAGKSLLVLPLQGYGDQIQYSRFFNDIANLGCEITAIVPAELVEILSTLNAKILPLADGLKITSHDYWAYPISLPHWLRVTPDTISGAPYLRAKTSSGSKIGIAWSGNPAHPNDLNRSARREDFSALYENFDIIELGIGKTGPKSFQDTANLLDQCKAIVSVDTSVVHLAGAIGCPCHLILPAIDPDWRWMQGSRTHWYDTVSISRQETPGGWQKPIEQIVRTLREQ